MDMIKSVWCPLKHAHVTCLTDLEGVVENVVCYDYDRATRTCRMKRAGRDGGPLGQLLTRVSEHVPADSSINCLLA